MFNVGDRVICRDASNQPNTGLKAGCVYTVTRVNPFNERIQVDNFDMNYNTIRFVLVASELSPFSVWEKGI